MKRYAWIETIGRVQVVKDVCVGNPYDIFPADVAKFYSEEIPDNVINGAIFDTMKQEWINPPEIKPSILDSPIIKVEDLKEYVSKLNIESANEELSNLLSLIYNDRIASINNQDGFIKQILSGINEKENI